MLTFWLVTLCDQELRSTLTIGTVHQGCGNYQCLHSRKRTAASFICHPPSKFHWLYTLGQVSCVTHYTLNILWIHTRTRADCIHKSSSSSSPFLLLHTCFFCKTTEEHEEGAATHSDDSEGSHLGQSCTAAGPMECTFSWFWYKHRSSMFVFEFNAVHSLFSHLLFARKIATPHIRAGLSFLSYRKTSKQTK